MPGITIQGTNGGEKPAFVAGPNLDVENPELRVGNFNSFDPNQPRQSFILSVSPSFRLLNLSTELPPEVSGAVGGIFITPSNATVYSSILNRPFVPPVVVTPTPVVVTPTPVVVTPPPVVVTLILLGESTSSVADRDEQEPTVSPYQVNAPLLSIAEDTLTRPCSVSELTMAADGRYVLTGCEP